MITVNKRLKVNLACVFAGMTILITSCEGLLENRIDTSLTPEQVFVNYDRMLKMGYGVYTYVPNGFNRTGGALFAAVSDEAEHTDFGSSIQSFNLGSWDAYNNPDDIYAQNYRGIRSANLFLEKTIDYKSVLARDTFTVSGKNTYLTQINDIGWMRGEVRFVRAYLYFELVKRYGGVPLVVNTLELDEGRDISRSSIEAIFSFIVSECNDIKDSVRTDWAGFNANEYGRATKGAVLALKSRALLYAASPLFNSGNERGKWEQAAEAAFDLIDMGQYSIEGNYQNLFVAPLSRNSREVIFFRHYGNSNAMETAHYPIGTPGGKSGTTPSQNLVDSYEKLPGWSTDQPFDHRDPRLQMSIVVNNSVWNGRNVELWEGGMDGRGVLNASKTGFYLKKFLSSNLDIINGQRSVSTWIHFRYAEILLNYSEAMNEAFGPHNDPLGYGLTAVDAINLVRQRPSVSLPPIENISQSDLRVRIRSERRVELAFEDHRFWDVRRWKIASETIGVPLEGIRVQRRVDGTFQYTTIDVEPRTFLEKMYLYPIPMNEINKSNGLIEQNPGW